VPGTRKTQHIKKIEALSGRIVYPKGAFKGDSPLSKRGGQDRRSAEGVATPKGQERRIIKKNRSVFLGVYDPEKSGQNKLQQAVCACRNLSKQVEDILLR